MAAVDFGFSASDPETWVPTIMDVGQRAIGTGTPAEQIVASALILVVAISASFVTLGATVLLIFIVLPFLFIGFLRLVPPINRLWPLGE